MTKINKIEAPHTSVMLNEMLENLKIADNEIYLDATFGAGGYSRAILNSANCKVYAIDQDPLANEMSQDLSQEFPNSFKLLNGRFSQAENLLATQNIDKVDGIVLDIGVSSMQFDDMKRGFSFNSDAKLDMRMDQQNPVSAYEIINEFSEKQICDIIKNLGEEPKARAISKKIVEVRQNQKIESCSDLAKIIRSFYKGYFKIDPATKTFQGLRIFVNQELEELKQILESSLKLLKKDGRLIVVSFHSLEDKIVKNFLKKQAGLDQSFSRYEPVRIEEKLNNFTILTKSAISPSKKEVDQNPRARSAKMRVATKN